MYVHTSAITTSPHTTTDTYVDKLCVTGVNPMDNLKVNDLRIELSLRGMATTNKKKPQLEKEFDELRGGIVNVPARLPETPLQEIGLEHYEVSPVEPLHGHLSNIIDELHVSLTGEVKHKVEEICSTVLGKETLRGSDYRF